jgi:hypothetical protein
VGLVALGLFVYPFGAIDIIQRNKVRVLASMPDPSAAAGTDSTRSALSIQAAIEMGRTEYRVQERPDVKLRSVGAAVPFA